jgi:hypothetical protein
VTLGKITMPKEWLNFIDQNFGLLWFLCVAWAIGAFTFKFFWHRSKGRFFTDPRPSTVIYSESFASGRSFKSFRTRFGGAANCLKIMLTREALWIRPFFPFLILGPDFDLVHVIPVPTIEKVEKRPGMILPTFRISFRLHDGSFREIDIASKKAREFETALSVAIETARQPNKTADRMPGNVPWEIGRQ